MRRRRQRGLWGGAVVVLAVLVGAWVAWPFLVPRLARPRVLRALEDRTGRSVRVGTMGYGDGVLTVRNVAVDPLLRLDEVAVETRWAFSPWPSLVPKAVHVRGGSIYGDARAILDLVRRVRKAESARDARKERSSPRPALDVENLAVQVELAAGGRTVEIRGEAGGRWAPGDDAASVTISDVSIETGDGTLYVSRAAATIRPADPFPLRVTLDGVGAELRSDLALAGGHGTVQLADPSSELRLSLEGGLGRSPARPDGPVDLWKLEGKVDPAMARGDLTATVAQVDLAPAADALAAFPWIQVDRARFAGHLHLVWGPDVVQVGAQGHLDGLGVDHRWVSAEPIGDIGGDVDLSAWWRPVTRTLEIEHLRLSRKGATLDLSGTVVRPWDPGNRRVRMTLSVPEVSCQTVLEALPRDLVPALVGFRLSGTFTTRLEFDADWADLDALRLSGRVGIDGCTVVETPAKAHPSRLRFPFTHRVRLRDGSTRLVRLFPGSGSFTSLDGISPYMTAAVLTTEDGAFFRHRGFLPGQIVEALRRNLKAGRIRLGASTLTMQLAKNLFLSHERTVSRKLQEFFLTWHLERVLDKRRILELYLNVVEFGPGIYGVTEAAAHYFGKHPGALTPPEAYYLALMLPSPVRRHADHCRGRVSDRNAAKLRRLLSIARARGRIDEATFDTWKDVVPVFAVAPEDGDTARCMGRIDALLRADKGQAALSGLLSPGGGEGPVRPPPPSVARASGAAAGEDPKNPDLADRPAMEAPPADRPAPSAPVE